MHAQEHETALRANDPAWWAKAWEHEGRSSWRGEALSDVYLRIEQLVPTGERVVDIGGGVGILGARLRESRGADVEVWEHNEFCLRAARDAGLRSMFVDLEKMTLLPQATHGIVVATEVIEHLSPRARAALLDMAARCGKGLFSVPNDRLGPDEEPQHTIRWTPLEFKRELQRHFADVRVEVIGGYLLGVCGFPKGFRLSVTTPARDEAADLDRTLASFMGIADEIVVGVDPRTTDATREVAAKYADVVFELEDPTGWVRGKSYEGIGTIDEDPGPMPEKGVNFGWIRRQCSARCTGDWIFMTEAHERLWKGVDTLLQLKEVVPKGAKVALVYRNAKGERWAFPWLYANDRRLKWTRSTHNTLDYPDDVMIVRLPAVHTMHERVEERELARARQRTVQNRVTLMDDWIHRGNENSLYYLGSEWRDFDPAKGIARLREYLAVSKNGPAKYHARLMVAKELGRAGDWAGAREVLTPAASDDWSRTEHYMWLGDIALDGERFEEAFQWYRLAATRIGDPPFTTWWIDIACYSYLPAQRMAVAAAALGRLTEALTWARTVLELLPEDAPAELVDEAKSNIEQIEGAIT